MVTTEPLIGARIPDMSDGPLGGLQTANLARDLIPYATPRFPSVAARNTAYAAWVADGNTMVAGLECITTDRDLKWRYNGSAWALTGWAGDNKADQPMISLRWLAAPLGTTGGLFQITGWSAVVDHGAGLLAYNSGVIQCNVPGRNRIEALANSDAAFAGWSWAAVSLPAGGGSNLNILEDYRQRTTGYGGSGTLKQPLSHGPIAVLPGDGISMSVGQQNGGNVVIPYDLWLTVTYV